MTEFREGDRVSIEGTVWHRDHDGDDPTLVLYTESGGTFEVAAADVTLLDRPTPPLPTEPGTTGTATVRGVEGVRVMRTRQDGSTEMRLWVSEHRVGSYFWHDDSDLADFEPDVITAQNSAITAHNDEPSQTDLCECGHGRDKHSTGDGPTRDGCWHYWGSAAQTVKCACRAYRPATPSGDPDGWARSVFPAKPGEATHDLTADPDPFSGPATPSTEETR